MKYLFLLFFISPLSAFSQDKIKGTDGKVLDVKIIEVNDDNIKYKMTSYLDGPTHTMAKSKISEIIYANGTIEKLNLALTDGSEAYNRLEKENIGDIFKRGNKVFVTKEMEVHEDAVQYLKDAIATWGYWEPVDNIDDADFVIQYLFEKKFMDMRAGKVVLKTRNGIKYKESKEYKRAAAATNGWNGSRDVANQIVNKYLKKEFK